MNFSAIAYHSPVGRLLRAPLLLIPRGLRVPILQGPLRGRRWIVGAGVHGCWLGSYEMAACRLFAETVTSGSVVYDIGANAGYYTLLAAARVGPAGRVVAFEPLPRSLAYLRAHLRLNEAANVTVVPAAVSDRTGTAAFSQGAHDQEAHLAPDGELQVDTVALDDLVAAGTLPPPDFVKIDVEGAEGPALAGAADVLARARPTLFLSTHGEDSHRACCASLAAQGYTLQPIGGEPHDWSSMLVARPPGR